MAKTGKKPKSFSRFVGGIADYIKEGIGDSFSFGRSIDFRSDPRKITLLPKTTKESGSTVIDLVKWFDRAGSDTYGYGNAGNMYKRTSGGVSSNLRSVGNSHGNGLGYFPEDDFLYYTSDRVIGRYGPIAGTPTFSDDFLGSEGGVPLNTHSVWFDAASSQYASRADTASLSITGNLTLEAYVGPFSLPTAGNSMAIISKWDENGNIRSYKLDLYGISGYFGSGADGALTISSDTTDSPIDSACTGTSGANTLSATNASFANDQIVLIHQTRGTGAGTYQRNKIIGYTAGTITLEDPLNANYTSGAQVLVLKQYSGITVNSGVTWSAKAWNGTVGGILGFVCSGSVNVAGTISAAGKGFLGASAISGGSAHGKQGEGTSGARDATSTAANGNGGGGGEGVDFFGGGGGGGGGNGAAGSSGAFGGTSGGPGTGGDASGSADLTTATFGGGGGSGGVYNTSEASGAGGNGGGLLFMTMTDISVSGQVICDGAVGGNAGGSGGDKGGGGGGAGGSILLKCQTASLGSNLIISNGGTGGSQAGSAGAGGNGAYGRIHIDYYTSYSGTTIPSINAIQDSGLVTTTSYQMRLGISSNGTNQEFLTKSISIVEFYWWHLAVVWTASTSTAEFFLDGISQGTRTGTFTSINNNASRFAIAADFNSSARNFFDGYMDDVRVWSTARTAAQIFANKDVEVSASSPGLNAYYQLDATYDDATSNANHLTGVASPVFTTSVPFSSPTSRLDLDQSLDTTGNTYTVPTTISEAASGRQTFVPTKDPQKSIEVLINAAGSGDWTLTVHDGLNRTIASVTGTNAQLPVAGDCEFIFDTPWRPVLGQTYHFHLTSTVADGSVVTTTASDLETADFHTYYQFLVTDVDFHPIAKMLNFLVIGNERYVAKWDASTYTFNKLTFPAGYRVRCFGKWREYLAIGCWNGSNIYDYDEGIIFFWDGISATYNYYIIVPEGAVNAMTTLRGELHIWAGYQGDHLVYRGGDGAQKIKRLPKITPDKYVEIFPGAATVWRSLIHYGVAGNSDSTAVERGVYSYGSVNGLYANALSYDYPISTGNRTATNIKVGAVFPVEKKLLISWQDNTSFGIDVVNPAGSPFATGTIEFLVQDEGGVWKEKMADVIRADFEPLVAGQSINVKYKFDRESSWHSLESIVSTVAATKARLPVPATDSRHQEYQVAVDLATSVSTSPGVLAVTINEDLLIEEEQV